MPAPAQTPSMAEVGQNWAQQQLGEPAQPVCSNAAGLERARTDRPVLAVASLPDQTQAQSGVSSSPATALAPTPTPASTPTPTPAPSAPAPTTSAAAPAPDRSMSLQDYAKAAAARAGIDPNIFTAQIQQESSFNPTAKSPAGAQGIAQFMPATAAGREPGPERPVRQPRRRREDGCPEPSRYGGDYAKTLAAYNAGGGNVDKYGGVPPFAETQNYVKTIMGNAQQAAQAAGTSINNAVQAGQDVVKQGVQAVNTTVQACQAALARAQPVEAQRQFEQEAGLSAGDAYTACGPVAAAAFAATYGRNPTPSEAIALAKQVGWNPQTGMAGVGSEVKLLNAMGIDAHATNGVDWASVGRDASGGNPVDHRHTRSLLLRRRLQPGHRATACWRLGPRR